MKSIAFDAYAQWSLANLPEACPESLSDLEKYRNSKSTKDEWGNELIMLCDATASTQSPFFIVISKGPDGRLDTDDDIRSSD